MIKTSKKIFIWLTILAVMLTTVPIQPAKAAASTPAAPSDLIAQASYPGDLAISLWWTDNSTIENAFEIERCAGVGCTDFVLIAVRDSSIWGPWFNDVQLDENTSYSYRVRAVGDYGASGYSNVASATTSYAMPDGQVTSLVGTFNNGAVELTWTENATNETHFEIERYEVGGGGTQFIVVGTVTADSTSFVDYTALNGTSYDYRVVPWRYDVQGGAPIVVNVQTGTGIPSPVGVRATANSSSSIRVTWKGKFDAAVQVQVQRENCDQYSCYGWLNVGQVDASSGRFTDTGLSANTTYAYRIRAISDSSVSPFTNPVYATTRR